VIPEPDPVTPTDPQSVAAAAERIKTTAIFMPEDDGEPSTGWVDALSHRPEGYYAYTMQTYPNGSWGGYSALYDEGENLRFIGLQFPYAPLSSNPYIIVPTRSAHTPLGRVEM
jgi:hypothetical protein